VPQRKVTILTLAVTFAFTVNGGGPGGVMVVHI